MKQTLVILFSLLFLSAVRAVPLGGFLIQERHVVTEHVQIAERQLLDVLSSIVDDISEALDPPESTTARSVSTGTTRSSRDGTSDRTTSTRSTSTRTSSSRKTSSTSSRSTSSSTSETITSESTTSESTTSTSPTTSVAAETAVAAPTPEASQSGSSGPRVGAIAGGVAGGIAFLIILGIILFWGCGPLKKWRENRAYEKMMDRSYRPALDDPKPFFNETRENGLGLNPPSVRGDSIIGGATAAGGGYRGVNLTQPHSPATTVDSAAVPSQRALSFSNDSQRDQSIRRKPLPTIGTGGGGGSPGTSPLIGGLTPTGHGRAEPWLPGGPR